MALKDILLDNNKKDVKKLLEKINAPNDFLDNVNSLNDYLSYFNDEVIDNLIIKNITIFIDKLINNFANLDFIYISIDGVPSKAKMIEQKKEVI